MSAPLNEYLIHIPDHPNALEKRLAVRPQHLKDVTPKVQAGIVLFGGATLAEHPKEGEQAQMTGSVMLVRAESVEKARELIENDVYTKGGAWDAKKATVWPFKTAVRTAA